MFLEGSPLLPETVPLATPEPSQMIEVAPITVKPTELRWSADIHPRRRSPMDRAYYRLFMSTKKEPHPPIATDLWGFSGIGRDFGV